MFSRKLEGARVRSRAASKVTYSKIIPNPDRVMAEIGKTRHLIIEAGHKVRPFGPAYHALHMVMTSIGGLASFISGERDYFATRFKGGPSQPTFPPHTLDLDEHPLPSPEELAPFQPKKD